MIFIDFRIQQGGVFGYVAMFPPQLMGVCMFGQGFAGALCNLIRIGCVAGMPPSDDNDNDFIGSLIYFCLASVVLILGIILFIINERQDFT